MHAMPNGNHAVVAQPHAAQRANRKARLAAVEVEAVRAAVMAEAQAVAKVAAARVQVAAQAL